MRTMKLTLAMLLSCFLTDCARAGELLGLDAVSAAKRFTGDPANRSDIQAHRVIGFYEHSVSSWESTVILVANVSPARSCGGLAYGVLRVVRQGEGPWYVKDVVRRLENWCDHQYAGRLKRVWVTDSNCDTLDGTARPGETSPPASFQGPVTTCLSFVSKFTRSNAADIVVGQVVSDSKLVFRTRAALLTTDPRPIGLAFGTLSPGRYRVKIVVPGRDPLADIPIVVEAPPKAS